jgi:hypothetical protein
MPILGEHTTDALRALLGTMSVWARRRPDSTTLLFAENHALQERVGQPIRSSPGARLVTARRLFAGRRYRRPQPRPAMILT